MRKMKNILLALLAWTGMSCSNFLDMDIPDVLPDEEFWRSLYPIGELRDLFHALGRRTERIVCA